MRIYNWHHHLVVDVVDIFVRSVWIYLVEIGRDITVEVVAQVFVHHVLYALQL